MRALISLCVFSFGCASSLDPIADVSIDDSGVTNPVVDQGNDSGDPGPGTNQAPVANAGPDLVGTVPEEIELNGELSSDPDGDILNYQWVLLEAPSDSAAFLINERRVRSSFYADRDGTYVVELTVDDGFLSSTDEVEVQVAVPNEGPIANAGPDQTVDVGDQVMLNGANSYDPDGDQLKFQWTIASQPAGSYAVLSDRTSPVPTFSADVAGAYIIELRVTDDIEPSNPDQVRVIAQSPGTGGGCDNMSCAAAERVAGRTLSVGNAASSVGFLLLPLIVVWARRRER